MLNCVNCQNNVIPTKGFSWILFILLLIICFPLVLLQLIHYWVKTAKRCPVCKEDVYSNGPPPTSSDIQSQVQSDLILPQQRRESESLPAEALANIDDPTSEEWVREDNLDSVLCDKCDPSYIQLIFFLVPFVALAIILFFVLLSLASMAWVSIGILALILSACASGGIKGRFSAHIDSETGNCNPDVTEGLMVAQVFNRIGSAAIGIWLSLSAFGLWKLISLVW